MAVSVSGWRRELEEELKKPYFSDLRSFLSQETVPIYPPSELIFNALVQTPFEEVKVVIVGQDPYHGPGQAEGLSFSVPEGVPHPPSLRNIFKELQADLGIPPPQSGSLLPWAKQGVLLLNTILTVRASEPGSHKNRGWEQFTDAVIQKLLQRKDPIVFVLWGKFAQQKIPQSVSPHVILSSPHPSPFSADSGFFGSRPFSAINRHLLCFGKTPIDWTLS